MGKLFLICGAEIRKQRRHDYHSAFVWLSLLLWPVLGFFEVYYTYQPFAGEAGYPGLPGGKGLLAFLATGYMAYTCFWSMVQNAWSMSLNERRGGTLEIAFLSPANRLAMNYGRALGALLQEVWMFLCFCLFILFYSGVFSVKHLLLFPPLLLLLIVSSALWGGMLNAVFLFSRDAGIIMDVLDTPMVLFSGTRIPTACFPLWARLLSMAFPLTYCLNLMRLALHITENDGAFGKNLLCLVACCLVMILITVLLIRRAEGHNRETGEWQFF